MAFFGAILTEGESTEIIVPPGHCLKVLQANADVRAMKSDIATLLVQTPLDDEEVILACLSKKGVLGATLQHEFVADDSPVVFRATGCAIHLSGNWIIDEDTCEESEESEGEEGDCGGCCTDDHNLVADLEVVGQKMRIEDMTERSEAAAKKTTRNKRGRNGQKIDQTALPAPAIVVASKPTDDSSHLRKKWRVKPQNEEGLLVEEPKTVTKSNGILIVDHVIGKGKEPKLGSQVKIVYEGMFPNGHVFDSNLKRKKPFVFRKGTGDVVRGLDLGLEGMRVGGSREIMIPSELGYGPEGLGPVPGNQNLVFRVSMVS